VKKRGTQARFNSKKGQTTIFIIIGIIIILLVAIFIFTTRIKIENKLTPIIPILEETPSQLVPIKTYTEDCITLLTQEALEKIGTQGGYIDLDQFGIATSNINPTESDGIQFAPDSNLNIPYWSYLKASNDCKDNCLFSSQRPELKRTTGTRNDNAIESQLDWYITDNLASCLRDFQPFKDQNYIITVEEIKTTAIIAETDLAVYVEYPLEITIGDTTSKISQFYISLPINLKHMYNLATEITNSQSDYAFFEQQTLNLISNFQSLEKEKLPPKTEAAFEFGGGTIWTSPAVKKDIESMLTTYTPALQVPFTLNYERRSFPGDPIKEATYAMEIPVNYEKTYTDLAVRFDYLGWWPIYFNAGEGGIIQPESITTQYFPIGFQKYSTAYDISYPVVITITDPDALYGEGYSFMFALEANLRNNEPIDESFAGLEGSYTFQKSLLCNQNQKNSGNITITVTDSKTKDSLEKIQVAYTCGEETCFVGETDQEGRLTSQLPICYKGILSFMNPNYFSPSVYLTTDLEKQENIQLTSSPYIEKEIKVKKWLYSPEFDRLSTNSVNLDLTEQALITLTKIKETPGEETVTAVIEYWGNQTEPSTLRLVPGKYEAKIDVYLNSPVIIPSETRETGVGFFGEILGAEEEYVIPEVKFEKAYPSGGARLDQSTSYLTIDKDNLYNDNTLIFYIVSPPLPTKIEDLDQMNKIGEYSVKFRSELEPTYKK